MFRGLLGGIFWGGVLGGIGLVAASLFGPPPAEPAGGGSETTVAVEAPNVTPEAMTAPATEVEPAAVEPEVVETAPPDAEAAPEVAETAPADAVAEPESEAMPETAPVVAAEAPAPGGLSPPSESDAIAAAPEPDAPATVEPAALAAPDAPGKQEVPLAAEIAESAPLPPVAAEPEAQPAPAEEALVPADEGTGAAVATPENAGAEAEPSASPAAVELAEVTADPAPQTAVTTEAAALPELPQVPEVVPEAMAVASAEVSAEAAPVPQAAPETGAVESPAPAAAEETAPASVTENVAEPAAEPAEEPETAPATESPPQTATEPATATVPEPTPAEATEPATGEAAPDSGPVVLTEVPTGVGEPAGFSNRAPGVRTDRLPRIAAADTAPGAEPDATASETEAGAVNPDETAVAADDPTMADRPALERYAVPFENPSARPLFAIVIYDLGPASGGLDQAALTSIPFPVSLAIPADRPDAAAAAAAVRAAGLEVVMVASGLPQAALPADLEVAFEVYRSSVPEAVAVLDPPHGGFQSNRSQARQVVAILKSGGLGLLALDRGLNTAQQVAVREGLPAALIFRQVGTEGETEEDIRRTLDRAAFKAGQDGSVIVLVQSRPLAVSAVLGWALEGQAEAVALAPVSAVLRVR